MVSENVEKAKVRSNCDERYVLISNYRSIGLEKPAKLVLNRSTQPGRMGDLVFLIGPNNAGKSSIIDAIESISTGFLDTDIPRMRINGSEMPSVTLVESSRRATDNPDSHSGMSSLRVYLVKQGLRDSEISAIEGFVYSGRYNFSDHLIFDILEPVNPNSNGIVLSNPTHLVPIGERTREQLAEQLGGDCDSSYGTAICRMLVENPHQEMFDISDDALIGMQNQGRLKDAFRNLVRMVPMTSADDIRSVIGQSMNDSDIELFTDFVSDGSYVYGELGADSDIEKDFPYMMREDRKSRDVGNRSSTKQVVLESIFVSPRDNERTLALRLMLCYYLYQRSGYVRPTKTTAVSERARSVLRYDPFVRVEPLNAGASSSDPEVCIMRYEANLKHRSSELRTKIDNLSPLMERILMYMGCSPEFLQNRMDNYSRLNNHKKLLRDFENELSERMEPINDLFNRLYMCGDARYNFKLYVSEDEIEIDIDRGGIPIVLDNQSVGFKWFFDFFFTVVCGGSLKPGDIVLMDEPAVNLHPRGQMELRKVMKDFARSNQVTFVVSTHSPFLVSCDYLDEVRIVKLDKSMETHIENNFQMVENAGNGDFSVDSLDEVLESFTIDRHILRDPKTPAIFVEGITDYNYYTAFAKLLGVDDVTFLPIGGLLNDNLKSKLLEIDSEPILLVDADREGFAKKEELSSPGSDGGRVTVFTLSDADPSFVGDYSFDDYREKSRASGAKGFEVEDLFSAEDRANILPDSKESDFSSVFNLFSRPLV
ncbi:MAG: AAA family ATPase [Thermoplasmata archaeon]|nr:AAA family ATPase [Thermoplasmata archaeon]